MKHLMIAALLAATLVLVGYDETATAQGPTVVEVRVGVGSDDAEERPSGSVSLSSSDLELVQDKTNTQVVGMRFVGLGIPAGAVVSNAFLQLQADETGSDPTSLSIRGQASDDAATFAGVSGEITARPTTAAATGWVPDPWLVRGAAGPAQQSPNLAAVVQEVVSRPGWSASSALVLIIDGSGKRTAESFDGTAAGAPLLHVEYSTGGNAAPTTSGIAGVNVNTDAPDTVIDLFAAFDDFEDPDSALIYTVQANTNTALFSSVSVDGAAGTLTLAYAPGTNGTADITVRATDTGSPPLFVDTTFTVTVAAANQPPTTTGMADVSAGEDDPATVIDLTASFDDAEEPASALIYTVEANTNPGLFASTVIDPGPDTLTLNYGLDAVGTAEITIRATDNGIPVGFVETTFTVTVTEVNDPPALTAGSVSDLTVAQNAAPTSLGLAGLAHSPGGGADETTQTLTYTVTTVPTTIGPVTLADGTTNVTTGNYTLTQIQGFQFAANPDTLGGPEPLTITVTDNGTTNGLGDFQTLTHTIQITITDNQTPTVVEVRVGVGSDDAEERPSGSVSLSSSDLELVQDKTNTQVVGMRFVGLGIPAGAVVSNAFLQLQADETGSDPTSLSIRGQASDDAATFAGVSGEITARPTTAAATGWVPDPWLVRGAAGPAQQSPNLAAVVQEVVSRPGWSASSALVLIIDGSGKRTAESFDGTAAGAPLLHVEYSTGGNAAPTTSGIAGVNVNTDAPDTVIDLFAAFDDFEDPDSALIYTVQANTNTALFSSVSVDGAAGTLTLAYAPGTNGTADITVRATDTGSPPLFVDTTFTVTVAAANQPPTTTGMADVSAGEDDPATVIDLTASFDDAEEPASALIYTVEANTNPGLFASTVIDPGPDTLTLNYGLDAVGTAEITIRATDNGIPVGFVETTFTVTVTEVNDPPALTAGSVSDLTVAQNAAPTSLGLAGLAHSPGGGADETTQTLTYTVTTVPTTIGPVTLADGTTNVTTGNYTLTQIQGFQFAANPDTLGGPEPLTITVTDNGTTNGLGDFQTLTHTIQITITDNQTPTVVEVRVGVGSDDAEERPSGSVSLSSSDLELVQDKTNTQVVGMRFVGLGIPAGAVVSNAFLQLQADETGSDPTSLSIRGQASDDAATFAGVSGEITARPTTAAATGWVPDPWLVRGAAGPAQQSPNLAAVVQEVVSRPGWSASSALVLIIDGSGKRTAESFDGTAAGAPLLHVEYSTGGNAAPTTSGIAGVNVNTDAPDTVIDLFAAFDDFEDPDSALIYTVQANTNTALFSSVSVDGAAGTLTLAYAPGTNGTADITVRATDTGSPPLFVDTTFTVTVAAANQPPTTTGMADVSAGEDDPATVIDLTASFDDAEEPASALIYTVEANTNPGLFASTVIDPGPDTLTLNYGLDAVGTAEITIRATDNGIPVGFVETTFTVTVTEVNDPPALTAGSVSDLTVAQNAAPTSLGLAGLAHSPGGGADETTQTLTYTVTTVPTTIGPVTLADGTTPVTTGNYTLTQIQGFQFAANPNTLGGPEPLTITVTDNGTTNGVGDFQTLTHTIQITITDNQTPTVVEVRVGVGSDDAEERPSGSVSLSSSDLELVQDKTNTQVVGMRFVGLGIPAGAVVSNAFLQLQADETGSDPTSLSIRGQASDDAATFAGVSGEITARPTTAAATGWVPDPWLVRGATGPAQQSPNLAAVVQEVVSRPGWSASSALVLIIDGSGKRTAESFDGTAAGAPLLHVEYSTGGNAAPTTSGIAGVNVNTDAPDTVIDLFAAFDDFEDPDSALIYTVQANTNTALFSSVSVDGAAGTLTLAYAPGTNGTADITVRATDTGSPQLFVDTTFTVMVGAAVFVGAGDIADCGETSSEATAQLLDTIPGTVFTIGDNAYPQGSAAAFSDCYEPTWGRHKVRTRPAIGDNEYSTSGAAPYFAYFGAAAGDPDKGYYSYDVGSWHIIALNSNCSEIGGCEPDSPQGIWLQADLAADTSACILAIHHEPLFSSNGGDADLRDFWAPLYAAGADIVLSGHRHHYERFAQQDPDGAADPGRGIRQWVSGTGGASLSSFDGGPIANSEVRDDNTHGVLKLTLFPTSYDWEFVPVAGQSFTDSGSTNCVTP